MDDGPSLRRVGIWIAAVADRVPGLTRPRDAPAMHMSSLK
jgi:hypothetical protein